MYTLLDRVSIAISKKLQKIIIFYKIREWPSNMAPAV